MAVGGPGSSKTPASARARTSTPPNKDELTKLMESIPMSKTVEKNPRPAIFVVGKTSSGKTILTQRIASKLGCEVIDTKALEVKELVGETLPAFTQEIRAESEAGKLISTQHFIEKYVGKDSCKFTGYIMDGLIVEKPISRPPTSNNDKPASANNKTDSKPNLTKPSTPEKTVKPSTPDKSVKPSTPDKSVKPSTAQKPPTASSQMNILDVDYTATPLLERLTYVTGFKAPSRPRTGAAKAPPSADAIPDYRPIIVYLDIQDADLKRRRLTQKVDPFTGIIYTAEQVEAATRKLEAKKQLELQGQFEEEEEEEKEKEDEKEEEEEEEGEEEEKKVEFELNDDDFINRDETDAQFDKLKKKLVKNPPTEKKIKLSNKTTWEAIPEHVLERLITRPEDMPEAIDADLNSWKTNIEPIIKSVETKGAAQNISASLPFKLQFLHVDATQHPDVIFRDVMNRIEALSSGSNQKLIRPKVLPPIETKGRSEDDIIRHYANVSLEEEEQPRDLGPWGKYCPVNFCENHTLTITNYQNVVAYHGLFHFLSSEANLKKFMTNPEKYLSSPMQIPSLKICILGGPFSGKSTQGRLLSQIYNLRYINIEEILTDWDKNPNQKELFANPDYVQVVKRCLAGKTVSAKLFVSVIKSIISQNGAIDDKDQGWILDGFPRTIDQANAMVAENILPEYTVILKNDINDLAVRERGEQYHSNSLSGKPVSEHFDSPFSPDRVQYDKVTKKLLSDNEKTKKKKDDSIYDNAWVPELEIATFPFFDNLFNGSREEFTPVVKILEEKRTQIINTQADNAIQSVLSHIQSAIDPFLPKADGVNLKNAANKPIQMETGFTKDYCPVTIKKKNILIKGSPTQVIRYGGKLYYLADEDAKGEFVAEPHNFANPNTAHVTPPPLRIAVIGPAGSGKSSCCEVISKASGAPHVKFDQYLRKYLERLEPNERTDVEENIKVTGSAPYMFLCNVLTSLFQEEPYSKKGFVLEDFPKGRMETEVMIRNSLHIDGILTLKIDSESLAKRLYHFILKKKNIEQLQQGLPKLKKKGSEEEHQEETTVEEIAEKVDKENNVVAEVTTMIESQSTMTMIEVDATKCLRAMTSELRTKLKPFIENRKSLFSNAYAVDKHISDVYLGFGVKKYSKFGKYCPVLLAKKGYTSKLWIGSLPVVYGEFVYFLKNEETKKEFIENTFAYVQLPPPKPLVNPSVCILGRPKSGKTLLAKRIAKEFDLVYLSVPIAVQAILEGHENTALYDTIKSTLESGKTLSDDTITKAIKTIVFRGVCQAKGWVLDGYPFTYDQALKLDAAKVLPQNYVELMIEKDEMKLRCENDLQKDISEQAQRLDVLEVIEERDLLYTDHIQPIKNLFHNKYANWAPVHAGHSKWAVSKYVGDIVAQSVNRIQQYHYLRSIGKAAPIFRTCINLEHVRRKLSKYGDYCVVKFLDEQELNVYYHLSSQAALSKFLENPSKYVYGMELPVLLPIRLSPEQVKASFPKTLELQGYCPVTLAEGPGGFDSIIPGQPEFVVEYDEKLYSMSSPAKLEKFMRTPWKYLSQKLPKKLPPKKIDCDVNTLPLIGYLEQTVSNRINEALVSVGKFKPKYPFKSLSTSANEYIALHLKANNPKSKEWVRKSFSRKLLKYKEECELIPYLSKKMGDKVYIPPESRELGFDKMMDSFLNLKPQESN